uniref:CylC n=1 Tax=Cylindrospermum licheniforme UTEX B 2014 TaxID=379530 RepID=K7S6E6_9NOST|nr:hypothetical protein [Cylindrospermum licheniforme UTEX B 2014]ARU81117.1 CylC [Cylindrospermum licheniforme UTEX B 2014]
MTSVNVKLKDEESSTLIENNKKKHLKVTEITYKNNTESNYTEKIEELDKSFNYSDNSNHYWSHPELSIFYGTPLYAEASHSQKIALNHLYWVTQYSQIAASEANTILYNDVTNGVFFAVGGYEMLCKELDLESNQEKSHIHAFHTISYKTKKALLGKAALTTPVELNQSQALENNSQENAASKALQKLLGYKPLSSTPLALEDAALRLLKNIRLKSKADCYSPYLHELEKKDLFLPGPRTGILRVFPRYLLRLFTLSWGSSSFLASQYYCFRYIANMLLKTAEYEYTRHYRDLEKTGDFIPNPTEVSRYHLLDESYHTTMSKLIAQDVYKDFAKPTAYERYMGNLSVKVTQSRLLGGLSGGLPAIFQDDSWFTLSYYKLLRSPIFNMSHEETLHWLEKCLCHEHEGFHVNLKYHHRLLTDLRYFFGEFDYMWPVNREMSLMAEGGSLEKAIQRNIESFRDFSKSFTKGAIK